MIAPDPGGAEGGPGDAGVAGDAARCDHPARVEGVCVACGDCVHELVLNGACLACGATALDGRARSPRPELVPLERLRRPRPPK